MGESTPINIEHRKAHSLYTTDDRGVNEVWETRSERLAHARLEEKETLEGLLLALLREEKTAARTSWV
jgi:hypothetical protein